MIYIYCVSRIRTDTNGGAWCPNTLVEEGVNEWLEIDLGELNVITAVETQGRFGNGEVMERQWRGNGEVMER